MRRIHPWNTLVQSDLSYVKRKWWFIPKSSRCVFILGGCARWIILSTKNLGQRPRGEIIDGHMYEFHLGGSFYRVCGLWKYMEISKLVWMTQVESWGSMRFYCPSEILDWIILLFLWNWIFKPEYLRWCRRRINGMPPETKHISNASLLQYCMNIVYRFTIWITFTVTCRDVTL